MAVIFEVSSNTLTLKLKGLLELKKEQPKEKQFEDHMENSNLCPFTHSFTDLYF